MEVLIPSGFAERNRAKLGLALPLGELSPQVTERALQAVGCVFTLSGFAALSHLSQRERQGRDVEDAVPYA